MHGVAQSHKRDFCISALQTAHILTHIATFPKPRVDLTGVDHPLWACSAACLHDPVQPHCRPHMTSYLMFENPAGVSDPAICQLIVKIFVLFGTEFGPKRHQDGHTSLPRFSYSGSVMRGAFVVRLGPETKPKQGLFEGWVEEVDSCDELRFHSTNELLEFLGERYQVAFGSKSEIPGCRTRREGEEP